MTTQEFIAKYEGWFSYTRREELKKEMEADLESMFTALNQPPVKGSLLTDCMYYNLADRAMCQNKNVCINCQNK